MESTQLERVEPGTRRRGLLTVIAIFTVAAFMTVTASAASAAQSTRAKTAPMATVAQAPVHGVAADGTQFNGTFQLTKFVVVQGKTYAVGRLTGDLGGRAVSTRVTLPVNGAAGTPTAPAPGSSSLAVPRQLVSCSILTLSLGPLDLDLLGLQVHLDQVNLDITAVPGAGNLLGNLLCGIAGLLDGGLLGGGLGGILNNLLGAIVNFLNGILGL